MIIKKLIIDGWQDPIIYKERFCVYLNDTAVYLASTSFKYLTMLAWSRFSPQTPFGLPDGWIDPNEIAHGGNQTRDIYRMKQEIKKQFPLPDIFIESNGKGHYRLALEPEQIGFSFEHLRSNPDNNIRHIATTYMEIMR